DGAGLFHLHGPDGYCAKTTSGTSGEGLLEVPPPRRSSHHCTSAGRKIIAPSQVAPIPTTASSPMECRPGWKLNNWPPKPIIVVMDDIVTCSPVDRRTCMIEPRPSSR